MHSHRIRILFSLRLVVNLLVQSSLIYSCSLTASIHFKCPTAATDASEDDWWIDKEMMMKFCPSISISLITRSLLLDSLPSYLDGRVDGENPSGGGRWLLQLNSHRNVMIPIYSARLKIPCGHILSGSLNFHLRRTRMVKRAKEPFLF